MNPVLELRDARLSYGTRTLWSGLDLAVEPGQFITVLGANGSGKSSLLKAALGLVPLSAGEVRVAGKPARRGSDRIGYVVQHSGLSDVPLRGRDLVRLGLDGTRWGLPLPWRGRALERKVDELVETVGATAFAHRPLAQLSGGEQQRLRIAQALATDPDILLCDEPLLSLDLRHQRLVVELLDQRRREHGTAVLFVTHEINPVLPVTDLVLYLAAGRFRLGTPDEVMTGESLSELYQSPVEVIRRGDTLVVLGADNASATPHPHLIGAP